MMDTQERIEAIEQRLACVENISRKTRIEYSFGVQGELEYDELESVLNLPLYYYSESAEPQFGYLSFREELLQDQEQWEARQAIAALRKHS